MLQVKDVHYQPATSEKSVLKGINLEVHSGEPVIISGLSGSGKTTLLEVISGLAIQQKGKISFNKKRLNARQRRWLSGVVFQFPERHFLGLTVSQELRLGYSRISTEKQIQILNKVGLKNINLKKPPEKLSGGEQRRLAIATQLIKEPTILILDEPTAGLDWSVRGEIVELLKRISNNAILIIMSHEPELFKEWIFSFFELKEGKLQVKSQLNNANMIE